MFDLEIQQGNANKTQIKAVKERTCVGAQTLVCGGRRSDARPGTS